MSSLNSDKRIFNDEQIQEAFRRSQEKIKARQQKQPESALPPQVTGPDQSYVSAMQDYYRPVGEAISDFAVAGRQAITNQLPGGVSSTIGAGLGLLPESMQGPASQLLLGPAAGQAFRAVTEPAGISPSEAFLEMGSQLQSGLITMDDDGTVRNMSPEELDSMFYDPDGTAREAGAVAGQVLSQVGVSLIPGGAVLGIGMAATSAAGSCVDQYYRFCKDNNVEYDPVMGAALGTMGGVSEYIFNKIPGAARARLRINLGITGSETAVRNTVRRAYIEALKSGDAKVGTAILRTAIPGFISEAGEEAVTEGFQTGISAFYRGFGGEQGVTMDELAEAAWKGGLYGGAAGGVITGAGGTLRASSAAKAGQRDRASLAAEATTAADEHRIQKTLTEMGLSEADATKLMGGIERARRAGGTKARRQRAGEPAGDAAGTEAGREGATELEDAPGVLRAALGDTRDSELTNEQAIQQALDAGLLPNDVDKEYLLSGEEGVDPEVGGPRPDLRIDRAAIQAIAKRIVERFPQLAQAIRDKGRLTTPDLALFLPGEAEYLDTRVTKKLVVEAITSLVDAKATSDKASAELDATIAEMEAVLADGHTAEGRPLTEEDKARIRAKIDEMTAGDAGPVASPTESKDEVATAIDAAAPVGGLSAMKLPKLLEIAAKLNITGRSRMRKDDLIKAIQDQLDASDPASDSLTDAESAVADARIGEIEAEIVGVQESLDMARDSGDEEAAYEYERLLQELENEYNDLTAPSREGGTDPTIETQARAEPKSEESDAPVAEETEVAEEAEAEKPKVESTGDEGLDAYNSREGSSGQGKLVEESKIGPVAQKAIAFIRRLRPGIEVIAYTDPSKDAPRGFMTKGRIYVRVGTAKSEQAAMNRGGRRYRRLVNRMLLDSYVQTLLHENVHVMDVEGGDRSGSMAAIDEIVGGMSPEQQDRALTLIQGGVTDDRKQTIRELRAELLTSIPMTRRLGLRSLYDADATIFERGLDRLRRLVAMRGLVRAPEPIKRAVLLHFAEMANAITSTSVPRTRVEGDAADIEMQARGRHEPVQHVRDSAVGYAREAGIEYDEVASREGVVSVDTERAMAIADLFDAAQNAPTDPDVLAAYEAMGTEVIAQYEYLSKAGYQMIPWGSPGQPYANSREMIADVRDNKRIYYYKSLNETEQAFGSDPDAAAELIRSNPLLRKAGGIVQDSEGNPYDQTVNDLFRAVHDIFGHAKEGHQFGPRGEENAWRQHVRMFTPLARAAMTTETRGQNSWVNYGPHLRRVDGTIPSPGDEDFVHPADRPYADQKVFVMPSWVSAQQGLDVEDWPGRRQDDPIEFQTRSSQAIAGKTAKSSLVTEDLRDAIPELLRSGGHPLPYARGQVATLSHGTEAHDRRLRNVRVSYPIGTFTLDDMKSIRQQVADDMKAMSPTAFEDGAAMFRSKPANPNSVLPLEGGETVDGYPVFDPEVLMSSFEDSSLREDKRFWYEASGDAIRSRTVMHPSMPIRKIADLLSATSPLTKVKDNFLRAYAIAGDFLYQGFSRVSLPTEDLVRRAILGMYQNSNSFKASSFGDTMDFLAGGSGSVPMTTNDIWVAYMFGMRKGAADGKIAGDNLAFDEPHAYLYTTMYLAKLTEEINRRIRSSPEFAAANERIASGQGTLEDECLVTPWTPWQLQAYPWSHVSDSGTFDEALDYAHDMLKKANHPAAVTLPDGNTGIDLNEAAKGGGFGEILQPNLAARFDTMVSIEVGGATSDKGSERFARKVIDEKLRDKELTEAQRTKLRRARGRIYRELNGMLRFLAGSNAGGSFPSMTATADFIAGVATEVKLGKTNAAMDELAGAMMQGKPTKEFRERVKEMIAKRQAERVVGADPDMADPIQVSLANLEKMRDRRRLRTVGRPTTPTVGFESMAGPGERGVRAFNIGYGLRNDGTGIGGSYGGLISPNLQLSMFGIPKSNRRQFMALLGSALGEEAIGASRWYVGEPDAKTHKPATIFTRHGAMFSGDEIGAAEALAEKHGGFVQFMSDSTGSHVVILGAKTEISEQDTQRVLSEIGADTVRLGSSEVMLVSRGDNNYGAAALMENMIDEDVKPDSEWRATLSKSQREAVDKLSPDDLRRALRNDATIVDRTRSQPAGVRRALSAAIRTSRAFRVHAVHSQIRQRNQQLQSRLNDAVNQAREDVAGMEIEFQQRQALTTTPEFKAWFRDSVVVDNKGNPLTVFHGTAGTKFDAFRPGIRNALGEGIYFTDNMSSAENYMRMKPPDGRRVIPVRLRIENPFEINVPLQGGFAMLSEMERQFADDPAALSEIKSIEMMDSSTDEMRALTSLLRRKGYDGVVCKFEYNSTAGGPEVYYVAFDPNQVKSAEVTSMEGPTEDPRFEYQRRVSYFDIRSKSDSDNDLFIVRNGRSVLTQNVQAAIDDPEISKVKKASQATHDRIFANRVVTEDEFRRFPRGRIDRENKRIALLPGDFNMGRRSPMNDWQSDSLMDQAVDALVRAYPDHTIYAEYRGKPMRAVYRPQGPDIEMQSRVQFDNKTGMGAVPFQSAGMYSMTKYMTADQFLRLVPRSGIEIEKAASIEEEIESGKSVAPPWLNATWDNERKVWKVTGHEGRHRSIAINRVDGETSFPVHVFLPEAERYQYIEDENGIPRRRKAEMSVEQLEAPFLGQRGSMSMMMDDPVRTSNTRTLTKETSVRRRLAAGRSGVGRSRPDIEMQLRRSSEDDINARNKVASDFRNAATAYGIPRSAIEFEFEGDMVSHVSVYDSGDEGRNLIARYPTDYSHPRQWAEDLRDILVSAPEQYGGWTRTLDMDFEEQYVTDDFGDDVLVEYMRRGGTEDIENVMKTLREERTKGRPAGMAIGHDSKAFGRWFRNNTIAYLMDEWHTLVTMVKDIEAVRGSKLPAKYDPVSGLRLAPGAVAEENRLFRVRTVNRVQSLMKKHGIDNSQLGRFMAASHALERNERIREINEHRSDLHPNDRAKLNCGISDETANRMLEEHADDPKSDMIEEIAETLKEISYETALIAKYAGLISDSDFDRITGRYKFYIPMNVTGDPQGKMFTDPVDDVMDRLRRGAGARGVGSQLDIATGGRSKLKYTLGRPEEPATVRAIVDGALAALFNDRMITQAEAVNNRIANRLVRLVERYPTKVMSLMTTADITKRTLDTEEDRVVKTVVSPESDPSLLPVRLEETREVGGVLHQRGDIVYIKIDDPVLVAKFGGGATAGVGKQRLLQAMHYAIMPFRTFTQLLRFTSTQFLSFGFTFTQPLLDGQTAMLATMEQGVMSAKQMVREMSQKMPGVLSTIAKSEFVANVMPGTDTESEGAARGKYAEYWDEFKKIGAKQQWFTISTVDDFVSEMSAVVSPDPTKKVRQVGQGLKRFTVDMYDVLNQLGDNMWRFSYYITLRENGVSAEEAGVLARNLTVDFSRKGELGGELSQIYAFFNASVQGNIRNYQQLFKGLKSGKGPARAGFSVLTTLGTLSALALQYIGGGDEDDSGVPDYLEQIPEWERRRSIIIPYGRDEKGKIQYAKIRLNYGLEIPYLLGFGMVEVAFGRRNAWEVGTDMLTNVLTAFNPLGGTPLDSSHGWFRMVLPDLADAALDIQTNRNWQGRQIYYGDSPLTAGGAPRSGIGSAKESYGVDWNATAKLLNWMTGGDEAHRGYLDMQPEVWRYLAGTFGGSALRNVERLVDVGLGLYRGAVLGEDYPNVDDYPVLRRWFGSGPDNPYPTYYYEVRRRVQDADRAAKAYEGQPEMVRKTRASVDGSTAMVNRLKKSESLLRKYRAQIRSLDDRMRALPRDSEERKRLAAEHRKVNERIAEVQRRMIRFYVDKGGEL